MALVQSIQQQFENALKGRFSKGEIETLFNWTMQYVLGWSGLQLQLNKQQELEIEAVKKVEQIAARLLQNEPIQYILGETEFYGTKIQVNPSVLIPRPETEELVDHILNSRKTTPFSLWDIGTGSGCIPIAIKKQAPKSTVFASDVSLAALATAKSNARLNNADVNFLENNVLAVRCNPLPQKVDIIVSNPPYVREAERSSMEANVVDFEPHLALFVPDNDPLVFYKAIIQVAQFSLVDGGEVWCEINENLGDSLKKLFDLNNFGSIKLMQDMQGKNRIIKAVKLPKN